MKFLILFFIWDLCTNIGHAFDPDWSSLARIKKGSSRSNIYNLPSEEWIETVRKGKIHTAIYPVSVTGLLIPYRAINNAGPDKGRSFYDLVKEMSKHLVGFSNEREMYDWLGLNAFNPPDAEGIYNIPYPLGELERPTYPLGASIVETKWGRALTFSCAACHSANLFGKTVLGLTNKTTRANRFFLLGKKTAPHVSNSVFRSITGANSGEVEMFERTRGNLRAVGAKRPQVLGLDTSLAQVALSLAHRNKDDYATKSEYFEKNPRFNPLKYIVADSKPAVWWNVKYKTRWLSDGSIISGNPILTNFLWNELGRGSDLKELEAWMKENEGIVKELTSAIFATKAPRYVDFFGTRSIDIDRAMRGEKIFEQRCSECHGSYLKKWRESGSENLSVAERIETTKVLYPEQTLVKNVGTDEARYKGTKFFATDLNELAISKWMKTVVVPQEGYVPPPLVGIWARYPYLHNNSIPNLCAFLTRPSERPKEFYQGPAINVQTDFDQECVGYPVGEKIPEHFKKKDAFFETWRPGMSNRGHSKAFIDEATGRELLSRNEKKDLIMFLKTL